MEVLTMKVSPRGLWVYITINLAKNDNFKIVNYDDLPEEVINKLRQLAYQPNALNVVNKLISDQPTYEVLLERIMML
ncbi:MAG: hypothetical protein QXS01_00945 [Candidatus Bathyarchaeia archaeon]